MKVFKAAGSIFLFMALGEKLPSKPDGSYVSSYVIWPRKNSKWDVRWKWSGDWEEIADHQFDTENAAFNHAYVHNAERQCRLENASRKR